MAPQARPSTSAGQKVPSSPLVADAPPATENIVPELQELWTAIRPFLKLSAAGPELIGSNAMDLFLNTASLLVSYPALFHLLLLIAPYSLLGSLYRDTCP